MKIAFVIHTLDFADHVAVAYLSAIAKQLHHETFFCNLETEHFLSFVDRVRPEVIAYSANVLGYEKIKAAHAEAKTRFNFISIMGGPHPTYSPETFNESGMDAYCVGEGEEGFSDFLLAVEEKRPFDDILNLITRFKVNPVRPLIKELDALPFPDRDLVIANSFLKNTPKKTFYATRGCPFSCAYCCNNAYQSLYKNKGPLVRRFSVDRVIAEIQYVKKRYRTDFVKFGDDLFAIRADAWLQEFSMKYAKDIALPFNCYLRLDCITDDLLTLLKKSGCFSVHLSIDSTSKYVRDEILHRNMKSIDMVKVLRRIRDYGINTWVNYMLAAPESTLQDDLNSIKVSRDGSVTYPSYSTTVPMKGTRLYDYCVSKNYIDPQTHKSDMEGCTEESRLLCFSQKEKDIRYNIYLLGALIAKLPPGLFSMGLMILKHIRPNNFFKAIRRRLYQYYIENKIFLLPKDPGR